MTTTPAPPTVCLRRLGAELRGIREELGWSIDAAVVRLGRSKSSLSKIENGRVALAKRDLFLILACYGIRDPVRLERLARLAQEGRRQGWWRHFEDALSPDGMDLMRLEQGAAGLRGFESMVVPGLLQTPAYIRALITAGATLLSGDVDRLIRARLRRQDILARQRPPRLDFVVAEAALRQLVGGPSVMREQLGRLEAVAAQPGISLRILPYAAGAHIGTTGAFLIVDLADPVFSVVFLESLANSFWMEDQSDVERYNLAFSELRCAALSGVDSRALIREISAGLNERGSWAT